MINNNRQAGRRRGRGGQQQRPQGNSGPRDNGNRIDNRSRGNAAQLLEKYKALARDSQMSGDRVNTEYYLQFADHYFRVLAETRSRQEENRTPQQGGANTFQDDETEYDDDGAPIVSAEPPRQQTYQPGDRQQNGGNYQGDRQNNGNQRDGQRDGQREGQQDRQANDRGERSDRNDRGTERTDRGQQDDDRPRRANGNNTYGNEGERYVREDRGNRNERNDTRPPRERYQNEDRAPVQQQEAAPAPVPVAETEPQEAPRRRGRPRRDAAVEAPAAFEADRLPPSLNISAVTPANTDSAPANDADEADEKPRRRRGRPPASEASSAG